MKKNGGEDFCAMSDEAVAASAKSGNTAAANHLTARYRNLVYKIAGKYFSAGAEQEDIVQEGMIGLYKAIRDFDPSMHIKFSAFAQICIKRQIISAVRSYNRKKHLPLNSYISLSDEGDAPAAAPEQSEPLSVVLDKENTIRAYVRINKVLSRLELRVLCLYLEGLSYAQLSKKAGIDEKSVDNAIYRIKKKLLFLLRKNDD